ncbi:corticospinal neuron axon guidance through spinal cord [Branchiostoma belcheri]|nr:corticospinal neuron axon guidance through spinal cord [Branchiostoma belcheri]
MEVGFTLVVLFVTWTGGCAASNLDCCEGDLAAYVPSLTCWTACSFRRFPAPLPPKLTGLRIEQQDIANIKVGDFPRHNVLERLYIKESNVVVLQPGAFEHLLSVYALDLGQNKIRRLEAETFKGLGRLVYLNLDHNQIHHIDRKAFVRLVRLRRLHLAWNCLSSVPQGIRSTVKLSVRLAGNPITSIPDVDELRHIDSLYLPTAEETELQCDCKLRKIKRWLREYSRWNIRCVVNATVQYVQRVDWEDLRCASPDVSVTLVTRASTGDTFTCQTDCREGLTFMWITPSGDYRIPSYEYSKNYTHVSNSSCKGSPVTRLETRRMCYSVLSVPGVGGEVEGTYTCLVTADHTDNASASAVLTVSSGTMEKSTTRAYSQELQTTARFVTPPNKGFEEETANRPDLELSTTQLVLVGLGSFCGCTVIVVVLAACVSWCHGKEVRQADRANRGRAARDGHNGTDDRGGHYENDDQFSDRNGDSRNHYENDSQFPDTDGARNAQYENDDEFSDTNEDSEGHYENDNEFSDTEGAKGGHYKNEDQFSDTGETREAPYENDDQFSDDGPSKNLQMTAPGQQASNAPARTSSAARAKRNRHHHNKRGLVKTRATSSNKPAVASNIVVFHAEVHASGHYDNETKDGGQNCSDSNARTASANGVSDDKEQSGHYDNDKTAKGSADKTDDNSDSSDHDYMSLPENKVEGREVGQKDPVSPSASASEVSENEYVTLPGTENDGENSDHTYVTLPGTENDGENSDHTYVTLPGTENDGENSDHTYVTLPGTENDTENSDHTYVTLPGTENDGENSDHTYNVTLPGTENAGENSDYTYNVTLPGTENASENSDHTYNVTIPSTENAGENSDHTYNVTIPSTENAEKPVEQQMKREKEDEQISAHFVTALSNSNDTDHVYVTVPDNADEQQGETDVEETNKHQT